MLGENIKKRRLEKGLTLLEVADRIGVKEATAQRYESGAIKNIKYETVVKIAEVLDTTPGALLGLEENGKPATITDDELSELDIDLLRRLKALKADQIEVVRSFLQVLQGNAKD